MTIRQDDDPAVARTQDLRIKGAASRCAHSGTQERGEVEKCGARRIDRRGGAQLGASVPSKNPTARIKPLDIGGVWTWGGR